MISATRVLMAEFLGTEDVAKWQSVNAATWKTFEIVDGYNVWKDCAERQFPHLFGDDALYEGRHRQMFLRCHALLLRVNYALGSILCVDSEEEAAVLYHQLRDATRSCEAHLRASGTQGHVLLGEMQLDRLAHATEFQFGVEGKPFLAGLPAGTLKLNIIVDGSTLRTRASYGSGPIFSFQPSLRASCIRLTLDVAGADHTMLVACQGVPISLDGCWRSSVIKSGLEAFGQGAQHQPFLCVLGLREEDLNSTDCKANSFMATSLNSSS
eukprot:TRINITY_DN5653_c0_g2_i8.p1 TRINITY_DN5653_c0_g2~~TRINITY_DN5653_c0_g2_i8.p1  ORF type:complete len:294 (-),score=33.32 TRINITY_DN5653_c0_g2_i8:340-1143(-)